MKLLIVIIVMTLLCLGGCVGVTENITPVNEFELNRYLGKWYEIARLDHSFERGLEKVSAEYSMRDGGGVNVINRGYSQDKQEWKEAIGKAFFVNEEDRGHLKVSFFGPFYGSYIIFELDHENYQYAFIAGPNLKYLWFLSRTPQVDQELIDHFIEQASTLGFNTSKIIFVNHK